MAGLPEDLTAWIDSLDIPNPTSPLPGESFGTGVPGPGFEMLNWDFMAPPLSSSPNLGGQPDLFGPLMAPTSVPLEASIPDYDFGLAMNYVLVDPPPVPLEFMSPAVGSYVSTSPPPDLATPFLSPALTDSSGSDWSLASDGSSVYSPLLSSLTALVPVDAPVTPDHPSAFPSPASVEEAFEIKAEIDKYVDSLTAQRRHRGSGPSLVKLKCSWCDKRERRPSELKEHMYAHRGLARK
ncbi:hypothetical protein FRC12_000161 [Ceratobasidium sp. 428]|nr:hypothetical protein FRC12_000161 [Ceratobasidium sp. 428]